MPTAGALPPGQRILIVRTSALGDIIHSLPVLSALRRACPDATIGWVVEKHFGALLADHPGIDTLIPVRLRPWRKKPWSREVRSEVRIALSALRDFRADIALDLMGNHKGALIARLSGARRVLGARRQDRREASSAVWLGEQVETPGRHAVDQYLDLLAPLGIRVDEPDFGSEHLLANPPPEALAFLENHPHPFVVIQAGAGWANKTYPPERWGAVARALRDDPGIETCVPIAPGEEELAKRIVAASDGAARSVDARAFSFLAALLRRACLVLGGDTGPVHMAHALGTPVLCLVGPTDPWRNGPYGRPEQVLFKPLPCSYCYKRFDEPKACLLAFDTATVARQARRLLAV